MALLDDVEARFVVAEENLVGHLAGRIAIDERQRVGAVPLHVHDGGGGIGKDAAHARAGGEVFEFHLLPGVLVVKGTLLLTLEPP